MSSTPSRGGGRGRGGRGRGGGALVNFSNAQLDYTLPRTPVASGYSSPIPRTPFIHTPSSSNNHTPSPSGYTTPKRGLAFGQQFPSSRGLSAASASRGGRGSDRGGRGGGRGGRGRGGSNGLGWANETRGEGSNGVARPFLVPVLFVKASAVPLGLDDEGDEADPTIPGELGDQVMEGGLIEVVRELELESDTSSSEDDVDRQENLTMSDLEIESTLIPKRKSMSPVLDQLSQLFVSDVLPSLPSSATIVPLYVSSTVVLGIPTSDQIDSDDEEEEIVFVPTSASIATLPSPSLISVISTAPIAVETVILADAIPKVKQPKLTKGQKRALHAEGKKARRLGLEHTRSGNRHLISARNNDVSMTMSGEEDEDDKPEPRMDDSDLEWGENGPGEEKQVSGNGKKGRTSSKRAERKAGREAVREDKRMERLSLGAREEVDFILREEAIVVVDEPNKFANVMSGKGKRGKSGMDEAQEDYARNVMGFDSENEATIEDMSFLIRNAGQQVTIDELEDRARALEEEEEAGGGGWRTTDEESGSGSDELADSDDELEMDIVLGEADAEIDRLVAEEEDAMMEGNDSDSSISSTSSSLEIEAALLAGSTVRFTSMGMSGPGGRRDRKEKKRVKKGKGKYISSDSEDDSDDDEMFDGKGAGRTWADNDEDYIRGVQDILDENSEILNGRDRVNRKKLFKAIEDGDFRGYDFDDDIILASGSKSKSAAAKSRSKSGHFAAELEAQWDDDRKKKGDYKRTRALARAQSEEAAPWSNKKGPKPPAATPGVSSSDVAVINSKIRHWLMHEIGQLSLSLPPMSKKSRVAVHLLAESYRLKSRSLGKGSMRFPVLERGPNSGVFGVDERRIRAILGTAEGESRYSRSSTGGGGRKATGKMGGLWAALSGDTRKSSGGGGTSGRGGGGGGGKGGDSSGKNREGAVVGQGADKISEGNIGYELLKRMGWTAGTQIGVSGGIDEPISARIKTNKSGLGSGGFSVTQSEAWKFASSDDWRGKSKTKDW